jgi:hypothetical protein
MRTAQIHRRLNKLSIKFRPSSTREFTLEQLCRCIGGWTNRGSEPWQTK